MSESLYQIAVDLCERYKREDDPILKELYLEQARANFKKLGLVLPFDELKVPQETKSKEPEKDVQKKILDSITTFQQSLTELIQAFQSESEFSKEYSFLNSDIIYEMQLVFQRHFDRHYDHVVLDKRFYLSPELIQCFADYWDKYKIDEKHRIRICKLFFLHEFLHIEQHVDSNTYLYSDDSEDSFQRIDYDADAFAVEGCRKTESSDLPWNQHLMEIIFDHIIGGEIFALLFDDQNSEFISGERLHRQAIWHLQYARARAFNSEGQFDSFHLRCPVEIEVFHILQDRSRNNLSSKNQVSKNDFQHLIELNIYFDGNRIRYSITHPALVSYFEVGMLNCDLESSFEAFRTLFDENPELTGRPIRRVFK